MALILSAMFRLAAHRTPNPNSLSDGPRPDPDVLLPPALPAAHSDRPIARHRMKRGLGTAYLGAATVVAVLYPVCRWYRGYKAAHRTGWARFV